MDRDAMIGQLFFVGIAEPSPSNSLQSFLEEIRPGGVVLFGRNIQTPAQVQSLNAWIIASQATPPFIAVDQEGGRVSRLKPLLIPLPTAAQLAALPTSRIQAYARALGGALAALGFNTDFAPVVDLSAPGATSGIGDRAFGEDPDLVAACAGAFIDGLAETGIAAFLKHFPGLGGTSVDSHETLPVCVRDASELWERDLLPYRACGAAAAGVMIAHARYPAFDPGPPLASSLSPSNVTHLLRNRIGFAGVSLTDDLEMGAVCGPDPGDLAVQALLAGNDMVMFCNHPEQARTARRAVVAAAASGRISAERIEQSVARILAAKEKFGILSGAAAGGIPRASVQQEFSTALEELRAFGVA